ncbi:MAG: gamma-butyrobetaine hydroxylase-like domain-containing protein [Alphaproteobacteria bacterium]
MATDTPPWPTEIRLDKDKRRLTVTFDSGNQFAFDAEFLRVQSPSADVQGHSPEQRQTVPGKRRVEITTIDPIGNYAIRITFDDGHNTGLFTWDYFRSLGTDHDALWAAYLSDLAQKGLGRD